MDSGDDQGEEEEIEWRANRVMKRFKNKVIVTSTANANIKTSKIGKTGTFNAYQNEQFDFRDAHAANHHTLRIIKF